jgi:hypothetical protein
MRKGVLIGALAYVVLVLAVAYGYIQNKELRSEIEATRASQADPLPMRFDFGKRQVEQVISDRPEMGEIFKKVPELRKIAESRFAGEGNGSRVYWENREPVGECPAEHMVSTPEYPSVVRVSRKINATEAFTCLLFELNNFMIDREYDKLRISSPNQRTTREAFAESCVRSEFEAILKTKALFKKHPLPVQDWAACPFYSSVFAHDEDFSNYKKWLTGRPYGEYDPYKYYREAYDKTIQASR